jgi:general secretion pathway protein C
MTVILSDRSDLAQTAIVYLLTLAALVLLGVVLAYWTWALFAPAPEPRVQPVATFGSDVSAAHALFGMAHGNGKDASPTGIAIRLNGVVAAAGKGRGYAVVQLDTKEIRAVHEGEEVEPGIRLVEVHPDHVILVRNGVRESLAWPQEKAPAASFAPQIAR